VEPLGRAVRRGHCPCEEIDIRETVRSGMKIPKIVNRPEMFRRNHFLEASWGGNRGARTGLGIESSRAAIFSWIGEPVRRRNIVVRAGHLHPGTPGKFSGNRRSG